MTLGVHAANVMSNLIFLRKFPSPSAPESRLHRLVDLLIVGDPPLEVLHGLLGSLVEISVEKEEFAMENVPLILQTFHDIS